MQFNRKLKNYDHRQPIRLKLDLISFDHNMTVTTRVVCAHLFRRGRVTTTPRTPKCRPLSAPPPPTPPSSGICNLATHFGYAAFAGEMANWQVKSLRSEHFI